MGRRADRAHGRRGNDLLNVSKVAAARLSGALPVPAAASRSRPRPLPHLHAGGFSVSLSLLATRRGEVLGVAFRPQRADTHLYSSALDPTATRGFGVGTSIELHGALIATEPFHTKATPGPLLVEHPGLWLPAYPAGTVVFSARVRRTGGTHASVTVTYGGCTSRACAPVVRNRRLRLDVPPR